VTLNLFGGDRGGIGLPGLTLQLQDSNGNVVATTTTGRGGIYTFNQLSTGASSVESQQGLSAVGTYQVVVVLPSFLKQVGQGPGSMTVTRGGQTFDNVNFEVGLNFSGATPQAMKTELASLQSLFSGKGTQSLSGGNTGGASTSVSGATADVIGIGTPASLAGLQNDLSSVQPGLTGVSSTGTNSAVVASGALGSRTKTGVVESTDSSGAGSSGSSNASDKPLDAAFQDFSKMADLIK
jgi:hypothetical protein